MPSAATTSAYAASRVHRRDRRPRAAHHDGPLGATGPTQCDQLSTRRRSVRRPRSGQLRPGLSSGDPDRQRPRVLRWPRSKGLGRTARAGLASAHERQRRRPGIRVQSGCRDSGHPAGGHCGDQRPSLRRRAGDVVCVGHPYRLGLGAVLLGVDPHRAIGMRDGHHLHPAPPDRERPRLRPDPVGPRDQRRPSPGLRTGLGRRC